MNSNGTFKGKTAQEMLDLVQQHWQSYNDQALQIDNVINEAKGSIEQLLDEVKTEFAAMLNKNELRENELEERWRSYMVSEMKTRMNNISSFVDKYKRLIAKRLPSLQQSLLEIQQLIINSDIDSIMNQLPAMLKSQIDQINSVHQQIQNKNECKAQRDTNKANDKEKTVDDKSSTQRIKPERKRPTTLGTIEWLKHALEYLDTVMMSSQYPEEAKIFTLASVVDAGKVNVHRDQISQKVGMIENIRGFIDELKFLSNETRDNAALFEDPSSLEGQFMLNWIGGKVDCHTLIKFLLKNGYLEGINVDKYIAKHFLFKGKKVTPKEISGLHIGDRGKLLEYPDYLQIPAFKKRIP